MIQLNLLPDLKKEYLKSQKSKATVISSAIVVTIAAIAVSVLLFIYVTFLQQFQIALISDDIKKQTATLKAVPDIEKYLTIQNQLKVLPGLHDEKGSYARLFSFLPVLNPSAPNDVSLTTMQLQSGDTSLQLAGNTASFESLNVFVDTLRNAKVTYKQPGDGQQQTVQMFSLVSVQNSALAKQNNVTTVAFTVRAIYNAPVFDAKNSDVSVQVPNIKTTSSVTDTPQLFENKGGQ